MTMRNLSALAFLLVIYVSCKQTPQYAPAARFSSTNVSVIPRVGDTLVNDSGSLWIFDKNDTILVFKKRGVLYRVISRKSRVREFESFQRFLDSHPSDSLVFNGIEVQDVTGDGIADSCISRVTVRFSRPFIEHWIISSGLRIYYDTLTIEDPVGAAALWEDELSYVPLKPHSAFFIAVHHYSSFVGDRVEQRDIEGSQFLSIHNNELDYWRDYLRKFKGHWIWYLDVTDGGGKIWDARSRRFIFFWGP